MIDAGWLRHAKMGVVVVNTARALIDATVRVYAADTLSSGSAADRPSPLLDPALADQTIFTPHSAAQTVEVVDNMGREAVQAVPGVMRGETPLNIVGPPRDRMSCSAHPTWRPR